MTLLPIALGGTELVAWRLDQAVHAPTWDSGEGAYRVGGRWNSKGGSRGLLFARSRDGDLEVAVHKEFRALDTVAHMMTAAVIADACDVHVVDPGSVPNPNWLRPGIPGAGQQAFGDDLLRQHRFVAIPSAVSPHSWNLIFLAAGATGAYALKFREAFALDTRLHPPTT
ncbi:RES domain-containing protein [Rhizobium leguminosarum]|uniref:RES domain-containing protein n=1 Tax=Rhizobium leguminosarum TaxID=384 RepID=A0A4Q8XNH1_RHILE|nr:RES domain-containing protein [Rhizobium leguminosarum]TAX63938.1 RES domain-containing protein [Rhizobium leguminosarum]